MKVNIYAKHMHNSLRDGYSLFLYTIQGRKAGTRMSLLISGYIFQRKDKGGCMKAFLILEDGTVFEGTSIGSTREVISEIVFNTSMTGYLEVLTDPSYAGQAVVMTYPLIGNYGICREDMESERPWPDGYIVRELSRMPSNFRSEESIQDLSLIHIYIAQTQNGAAVRDNGNSVALHRIFIHSFGMLGDDPAGLRNTGGPLKITDGTNDQLNHHFGMSMTTEFVQPNGGKTRCFLESQNWRTASFL